MIYAQTVGSPESRFDYWERARSASTRSKEFEESCDRISRSVRELGAWHTAIRLRRKPFTGGRP